MKMHVDKIAGIRLHHVRSDIILVSFAAQQVRGLYQPSPRQKLQSGPRARRCGTRLRLLWAKWVRLWIVSFFKKIFNVNDRIFNFSEKRDEHVQFARSARHGLLLLLWCKLWSLQAWNHHHHVRSVDGCLQLQLPVSRTHCFSCFRRLDGLGLTHSYVLDIYVSFTQNSFWPRSIQWTVPLFSALCC